MKEGKCREIFEKIFGWRMVKWKWGNKKCGRKYLNIKANKEKQKKKKKNWKRIHKQSKSKRNHFLNMKPEMKQ